MRNQSGFTIIELLVTVAVVGTLIAIALPNYNIFVKNNCLTTTTNNLVTSLQLARSESIKRGRNVGVHTISGWASGWIVFDDEDNGYDYDAGTDDILRDIAPTCGVGTMTITEINGSTGAAPNPNDVTASDTSFYYESTGFIDSAGTFEFCDDRTAETGRMITISITGRPTTNSEYTCT
ncbi:MAG: prepilin-type N-terminal cleavage/methylation domain-containing protein [Gammaproteobacteria bacterium]|nr:prepilin-type N-terminal cleavage/methylation domain-containing protein [Gammaproteobacteria bacterium]